MADGMTAETFARIRDDDTIVVRVDGALSWGVA